MNKTLTGEKIFTGCLKSKDAQVMLLKNTYMNELYYSVNKHIAE